MTFLKTMWQRLTNWLKPPKPERVIGVCDRCEADIIEDTPALCFHDDDNSMYLCEVCVEEVRKEFIRQEYAN
jgi:hypothetical protein